MPGRSGRLGQVQHGDLVGRILADVERHLVSADGEVRGVSGVPDAQGGTEPGLPEQVCLSRPRLTPRSLGDRQFAALATARAGPLVTFDELGQAVVLVDEVAAAIAMFLWIVLR